MKQRKGIFGYVPKGDKHQRLATDWFDPSCFLLKGEEPIEEDETDKPSFPFGKILLIILGLILAYRLSYLQVVLGAEHRYLAEGNRVRRQVVIAPRGIIVDRKGNNLVINEPGYQLDLIPADLPRVKSDRDQVINQLAQDTGVIKEDILKQITLVGLGSIDAVEIKTNLEREEALLYKMKFATLPGVRVAYAPTRRYHEAKGLAHMLGYTSKMNERDVERHPDYHRASPIGRSGLESSYDAHLRGEVGITEIEVNAQGQYQRLLRNIPPKVGKTLRLSLDLGLQQELVAALEEAMQKNGAKQSAAILMNPKTGGILASVSLPTYDNNTFAKGISQSDYKKLTDDPDKPLLNRVVDGVYPPGSTVKPFVAAAALQENTITPKTTLDTSIGVIKIGQWEFPDWKVHGITEFKQAIAESNDIFFYALGGGWDKIPGLGIERMEKYYKLFGFGESTGVDYTAENTGLVPNPEWKKRVKKESWYIGDTYHISIGQGNMLSTPIQLGRALSSLVNGGRLVTPHVVDGLEQPETGQVEPLSFPEERLSISDDVIREVKEGMKRTVDSDTGSARSLKALPFASGGKTGTAQFGTEEKTHAWYIGFAPYDDPEIVAVVLVEGGGEGNAIAVPVAGRVFDYYMKHK